MSVRWLLAVASVSLLAFGCTSDSVGGGDLPPYGEDGEVVPPSGDDGRVAQPTGQPDRPEPTLLAADQVGPQGMMVHDGILYWVNIGGTELRGVRTTGGQMGTVTTLSKVLDGAPFDFLASEEGFFFTDSFGQRLVRVSLGGGEVEEIATFGSPPLGLALADGQLYVSVESGGVYELALPGGAPELLGEVTGSPMSLAVGGDHLYVATVEGTLYRMSRLEPGAADKIASDEGFVSDLAADEGGVFWLDELTRQVQRAAPGEAPQAVASAQYGPTDLALDGDRVYFTTTGDHAVKEVGRSGGGVVTLAEEQRSPEAVAIDPTAVFWASADAGVIRRIER